MSTRTSGKKKKKPTREPISEFLQIHKVGAGHQELQQRPKFGEIVLQWCPRQQQPAERTKHQQCVPTLRLEVLDHMRLV